MHYPLRAKFTVPYGAAFGAVRAGGARTHQGLDMHAPEGTPIYTGQNGVVVARGYTSGYGNYADIAYPGNIAVRYAHMQYPAALRQYQSWGLGELQLGLVGLTGSAAYGDPPGAHLHVEVRILGKLVDPAKFFTPYGTNTAGSTGTQIGDDDMPTAEEIANAVWNVKVNRSGVQVSALQELADIKTALPGIPAAVWGVTVKRTEGQVSALQELADSKTNTITLLAQLAATNAALAVLATANGLDPATLSAVIAEAVENALEDNFAAVNANIDDQPVNFKITPE